MDHRKHTDVEKN